MTKLSMEAEGGRDLDGKQEEQGKREAGSGLRVEKRESLEGLKN